MSNWSAHHVVALGGKCRGDGPIMTKILCALMCLWAFGSRCPASAVCNGSADKSRQVDALFECTVGAEAPGASVLVAQSGRILHREGYGFANLEHGVANRPETVFRLGSITKTFTAMAVLQLHDLGLLHVDDAVAKHLPDAPHGQEIKIRHLLTHTSGIPATENAPLEFPPGERLSYSNDGYKLLGRIIEAASGSSYEEYLRANILDPLNMRNTGYDHQSAILKHRASGYSIGGGGAYINAACWDASEAYSAGALYSTVEDMYLWDQALSPGKLVEAETAERAFSPVKLSDGREAGYGFGWMIGSYRGLREIGHGGDITGFNSWIARFPDQYFTVIVLSNVGIRPAGPLPTARDLAHKIAEIYLADSMTAEESLPELALDPKVYAAYVGQYKADGPPEVISVMGDTITVAVEDNRLFAKTKIAAVELCPLSETQFFSREDNSTRVTFVTSDTGRATQLIIVLMGVREIRAKRLDSN